MYDIAPSLKKCTAAQRVNSLQQKINKNAG